MTSLKSGISAHFRAFLEVSFTSASHNILIERAERGMNPVAMTIINHYGECWPSQGSNKPPPVLKTRMEHGLGEFELKPQKNIHLRICI